MRLLQYILSRYAFAGVIGISMLAIILVYSCTNDYTESTLKGDKDLLELEMSMVSAQMRANTQVYVFKGVGLNRGYFDHKVTNISRANDKLSMIMPSGVWDIVLVGSEVSANLVQPRFDAERSTMKMWENTPVGGVLPSAPEIFTSYIDEQEIIPNETKNTSTSMARNVAMIKVVIKDAKGFKTTVDHTISLSNVPTTLTWAKGLYPNKTNPDVSAVAMSQNVRIRDGIGAGQISDTAFFVLPAHQGIDFLSANPVDTTTCKVKISVDLTNNDNTHYIKQNVELNIVPKANKILIVNLLVQGSLHFETTTHDWSDHHLAADISNTSLQVSKTNVGLSYRDTVFVKTNNANFTLTSGDPTWLTVNKLDSERAELVANINTYSAPRNTYVDVKTGNVTKRIAVRQRPDTGTITATPNPTWVSPSTGNITRTITINSTKKWQLVGTPDKVTPNITTGNGPVSSLTVTRKSTAIDNGDYSMYGDGFITLKNVETLEQIQVPVSNLYLTSDEIYAGAPKSNADTVVYREGPKVLGLSAKYTVVSKPVWITEVGYVEGQGLKIRSLQEPNKEYREGFITFAHADDPTYQITVKVVQDDAVFIDPFSFFVLQFDCTNNTVIGGSTLDLDIVVVFAGNTGMAYNDKGVGFSGPGMSNNAIVYNGENLMQWGGDNQSRGGETAFFNAPLLDNDAASPRVIYINVYCAWWGSNTINDTTGKGWSNDKLKMRVSCYSGGTMAQDGYMFNNSGGTVVYDKPLTPYVKKRGTSISSIYKTAYSHVATIRYNRFTHMAQVNLTQDATIAPAPAPYRPAGNGIEVSPMNNVYDYNKK